MANTLKFGNGQWATGNGTALAYNDENSNFKPLPFDFTRASSGTTVNQSGLIETVGSGIPRIDFQGNTKGALLLEPSRTNLVTYSEDFSQWNKSSAAITITPNYSVSPNGLQNSSRVQFTSSNQHINISTSLGTGVTSTGSVYIKGTAGETIEFDTGGVGALRTLTADWQRIEVTSTSLSSLLLINTFGGATARDIQVWGAQVEQASYATSYIPTSGSAVTRVADSCSQTPPDGVIGQTEGTIFANVGTIVSGSLGADFCSIDDGTGSNRIHMFYNTSSKFGLYSEAGGSTQWLFTSTNTSTGNDKLAIAYKSNDAVFYINGVQVGSTSSFVVPSTSNYRIADRFDEAVKAQVFQSKQAKLYNTRLSNSELAALTT